MDSELNVHLNSLHQGVGGNLPNGHEEKRRIKRPEEKRRVKNDWSNKILSLQKGRALIQGEDDPAKMEVCHRKWTGRPAGNLARTSRANLVPTTYYL